MAPYRGSPRYPRSAMTPRPDRPLAPGLDAKAVASELREYAGIEGRKVKVVGVGEYLEVWEPARLADRFSQMRREGVSARAKRLAGRVP